LFKVNHHDGKDRTISLFTYEADYEKNMKSVTPEFKFPKRN